MAYDFSEIHDAILDDEIIAYDATINGTTLRVVLALDPEESSLGGEVFHQAIAGKAGFKNSDYPGVAPGDVLVSQGVTYQVILANTDEQGWTTVTLGKSYA